MKFLDPGLAVTALTIDIPLQAIPSDETTFGDPSQGDLILQEIPGQTIGVWEMTPGDWKEREVEEVIVVLTGHVTVDFFDPGPDGEIPESVELHPGSVLRAQEGMLTRWTVHETVRKVFIRL